MAKVGGLSDEEFHQGYTFESGMFSRFRSWTDIAPWLALVRVLRVLASPSLIVLVTTAVLASSFVGRLCLGGEQSESFYKLLFAAIPYRLTIAWETPGLGVMSNLSIAVDALFAIAVDSPIRAILLAFGLTLIWVPVGSIAIRQGAMLTAGRYLPDTFQTVRLVCSRLLPLFGVLLPPIVLIVSLGLLAGLVRLPSVMLPVGWLATLSGWLVAPIAIGVGIIGFGAVVAVPMGLAATVSEKDPDSIDSLSRGYEYFFRRPLQLLWYAAVSAFIGYCVHQLFGGIAATGNAFAFWIGTTFRQDDNFILAAQSLIGMIWLAAQLCLQAAFVGGIYLLLRRDAGDQHVEEIWTPEARSNETLPKLPPEAFDS